MRIQEIMTPTPTCCYPETRLREVARMMVECDCGEIPVVAGPQEAKPVGVVTDRDIVCRTIAQGNNPLNLSARDCMSSPAITVTVDTSVDDCLKLMQERQVRRVPVVDASGFCVGIVSQADIAQRLPAQKTAQVVKEVSQAKPAIAQLALSH